MGRIYEAQGNTEAAVAAYQQALVSLERLRGDLASSDRDTQFSFREEIEPVYRDLVSLLLKSTPDNTSQDNLLAARNVIESLQVEELVNFFRADCVTTSPVEIDQIDTEAVVLYPIILPDRLEVLLSQPGLPLQRATVPISASVLNHTLDDLRQAIDFARLPRRSAATDVASSSGPRAQAARGIGVVQSEGTVRGRDVDFLPLAQQVYDWLIRPLEDSLQTKQNQIMVFVLDGNLRNIPMSVLHDGEQFLIEKTAIALAPGLQLLEPTSLTEQNLTVLAAGLSDARDGFSRLPNVEIEMQSIASHLPGEVLLNESFNKQNFTSLLSESEYPIVHLATHGEFSSNLEETFILAWDERLRATELSVLLQQSELSRNNAVELLVLSACETATGDDRAALGLAGIAVRSGARSTLATLWLVDDAGTSVLMEQVYRQLATTTQSKAEILRRAQIQLLQSERYSHPYFWAPFVLVGNWL